MKYIIFLSLFLFFLAGCQPVSEVIDGQLYLYTEDGERLAATYYEAPNPVAALILVHDGTTTRADWDRFANVLQGLGVSSLAFDMRGFGNSSGNKDYTETEKYDLAVAENFLQKKGYSNISLVGANVGANIGLRYAAYHSAKIQKTFLISPHLDWENVVVDSNVIEEYAPRELYMFVSKVEDPYWQETVRIKNKYIGGHRKLRIFIGQYDGFRLLDNQFDAIAGSTYRWLVTIPKPRDQD